MHGSPLMRERKREGEMGTASGEHGLNFLLGYYSGWPVGERKMGQLIAQQMNTK